MWNVAQGIFGGGKSIQYHIVDKSLERGKIIVEENRDRIIPGGAGDLDSDGIVDTIEFRE